MGDREALARPWPDPTPEQLASPMFEAIWQTIKGWDIHVPNAYRGYCSATGNHARAIMDALTGWRPPPEPQAAASEAVQAAQNWVRTGGVSAYAAQSAAAFARALLAEHARAEAAERELELAQVGLFHDSDGAQYSLLETKKILREREAAEAAVKRLTEASWLYIAEWAKAVGAAQAAEERATVAEAAIVTARAALTPAGGGDGR